MIKTTSLNGREIAVNAELIKTVEATPDTIITLTSGQTMIVRESVDRIIHRIVEYRRDIRKGLQDVAATTRQNSPAG